MDVAPNAPELAALESEAIEILREGTATADRPVLLTSIGKDSAVLPRTPPVMKTAKRLGTPTGRTGPASAGTAGRRPAAA